MTNFDEKPNYPFTYGDKNKDRQMLSDILVTVLKNKGFQSHMISVGFAFLSIMSYAQPSCAIPPEHGELVDDALKLGQNGIPTTPPTGPVQENIPIPGAHQAERVILPAMPIEQQHLIGQQQAGKILPGQGLPPSGPPVPGVPPGQGPTENPAFYLPAKPKGTGARAVNTVFFTTALGIICLNAVWGEPAAVAMCSTGLASIGYRIGKQVFLKIAEEILKNQK